MTNDYENEHANRPTALERMLSNGEFRRGPVQRHGPLDSYERPKKSALIKHLDLKDYRFAMRFDKEAGWFRWNDYTHLGFGRHRPSDIVGTNSRHGVFIRYMRDHIYARQLAWAFHHGEYPTTPVTNKMLAEIGVTINPVPIRMKHQQHYEQEQREKYARLEERERYGD